MTENQSTSPLFDLDAVFEVDDHMFYYADSLTDERTEAEVAALVKLAELDAPMKILDLACGFGRHANRMAALGHQVTGLDLIPGFLEIARRDAEARGIQVEYQQGDMRQLPFVAEYDRVLLLFTAFGYFEDEGNLLVLENVARALKPGGLFLFDIPNRDIFLKEMLPYIVTEKGRDLLIDRGSFDSLTGRWHNRRIIIRNGVRKDKPFSIRLYNPNEMRDLLSKTELKLQALYGGWDAQPISAESRRMIVVAKKP
jgi:SAM-dependent methyltransferase